MASDADVGRVLTLLAALGCGLMYGMFFAFSAFVMKALARLPASVGIAAMQAINVAFINRLFLAIFMGIAALCACVAGLAILRWHEPGAACSRIGSANYPIGVFGVTMLRSVPLNKTLARLAPADQTSAAAWVTYLRDWSAWNHARSVAGFAATAALVIAFGT